MGTMLSLGASVLLGLLALVVARVFLPSQGPAKAQAATPVQTTPVVVAAQAIQYGAKIDAKQLTVAQLPRAAAPEGAFTSVAQVMGQDGGEPVALMSMAPREPVLRAKVTGSGVKPTLAAMISPGMRAFTIGVSEVEGGGGHILPGDRVDVVLTREIQLANPAPGAAASKFVTDVVLQNVRVLGMDLNVDPNSTKAEVAKTATLEVDMKSAEKLALAAQAGKLSLALRRVGSAEIEPVRPLVVGDLHSGPIAAVHVASVRRATPRRAKAPPPPPPFTATVVITQGDAKNTVAIPVN